MLYKCPYSFHFFLRCFDFGNCMCFIGWIVAHVASYLWCNHAFWPCAGKMQPGVINGLSLSCRAWNKELQYAVEIHLLTLFYSIITDQLTDGPAFGQTLLQSSQSATTNSHSSIWFQQSAQLSIEWEWSMEYGVWNMVVWEYERRNLWLKLWVRNKKETKETQQHN